MTEEVVLKDAAGHELVVGDMLLAGNGRAFRYIERYSTSFLASCEEFVPRRGKWDVELERKAIDTFTCMFISDDEFDALLARNKAITVDAIKNEYMQRYRGGDAGRTSRVVLKERKAVIQGMRDKWNKDNAEFDAERGGNP